LFERRYEYMEINVYKCPSCGADIENENSKFCSHCGTKLNINDGKTFNYRFESVDRTKISAQERSDKKFNIKLKVYGICFLIFVIAEIITVCYGLSKDEEYFRAVYFLSSQPIMAVMFFVLVINFFTFLNND